MTELYHGVEMTRGTWYICHQLQRHISTSGEVSAQPCTPVIQQNPSTADELLDATKVAEVTVMESGRPSHKRS